MYLLLQYIVAVSNHTYIYEGVILRPRASGWDIYFCVCLCICVCIYVLRALNSPPSQLVVCVCVCLLC